MTLDTAMFALFWVVFVLCVLAAIAGWGKTAGALFAISVGIAIPGVVGLYV